MQFKDLKPGMLLRLKYTWQHHGANRHWCTAEKGDIVLFLDLDTERTRSFYGLVGENIRLFNLGTKPRFDYWFEYIDTTRKQSNNNAQVPKDGA